MDADHLRAHYADHGYARLEGAFPAGAAETMADAVWAALGRRGIDRSDPSTWTVVTPRHLARLRERGVFDPLGTERVVAAISALLGTDDWPRPRDWGGALVTFPAVGEWGVPRSGWHLDAPARGAPEWQLLVKWLAYANTVGPGGGGTVVLSGSHHLVAGHLASSDPGDPGHSRDVRDAIFAMDAAFADLGRLRDRGAEVGGLPVRVVELTGQPGDVVFLHPHLLHAAAPNTAGQPRFMITGQVVRSPTPAPAAARTAATASGGPAGATSPLPSPG